LRAELTYFLHADGTAFYATSLMTADQPWSGHYGDDDEGRSAFPVVWANAHITQFTQIGWKYLAVGQGSGELPHGGYFTTIADDTAVGGDGGAGDFTLLVVKISYDHAACIRPALPSYLANVTEEEVTFVLDASMGANFTELNCFKSNFQDGPGSPMFEQQPPVRVVNGRFKLRVRPGDYFSVSTIRTAHKGSFAQHVDVPRSQPRFPLPLIDDFDGATISSQPKYWSNELGVFEVHTDTRNASNKVLRQMVRQPVLRKPGQRPSVGDRNLACTVAGMLEWEDVAVSARFRLLAAGASGCVATRMDRFLEAGLMLCVNTTGESMSQCHHFTSKSQSLSFLGSLTN
jgi:galactosylceramidase